MIRALLIKAGEQPQVGLEVAEFGAALQRPEDLLWVDFEATPAESDEPVLRQVFGFHPLAIDDALQESHVPKLDDWEEYLYIVLHAVVFDRQGDDHLDTLEVDFFIGSNYLVTHHDQDIPAIDNIWSACQHDERFRKNGAGYLLYRIADDIVASYMPVVDALDEKIDILEDQLYDNPAPHTLERIFGLKRAVLHLRRIIGPQREVFNKLARDDYSMLAHKQQVYFRDIYDHLVRMHDLTESIRDLVGGTLDTYLSVINNRMNEIMKTLTIITTLFMPITFLTGFFGMNFFLPDVDQIVQPGRWAYILVLAIMALTPPGMYLWMRSRRWM
jgi:magnesium transporter